MWLPSVISEIPYANSYLPNPISDLLNFDMSRQTSLTIRRTQKQRVSLALQGPELMPSWQSLSVV